MSSKPKIVPFVDDTLLSMERGMTGATGNYYCGLHEPDEMAFVLHFLREDDLFLDIGANIGTYTVLASGAVGARTMTFEPIPETFSKLERNVAANGIETQTQRHNIGLGAEDGTLKFTADNDTMNHVVSAEEAKRVATIDVPVRRADDIVGSESPSLAKIDVEGWEANVLRGMTRTLANPSLAAIVMETNDSADRYDDDAQDEAAEIVTGAGFVPHSYNPFTRKLTQVQLGQSELHNVIFVRGMESVQARVKQSRKFKLINGEI
ncbi:FkbM family methyltransferase [Erythrobacter sp. F6033]|uniref:FkbM family methyltransferase n=1 Tax=Erythrobacter sp. F6033 TaxID=2926401 RepID=UPI001FF20D23|nr:FkbM family methyltransferase [Erythrobacter sp. F6033]MCK0128685.1 FkbM family methyltransferase [Erythrobacter sp. F6033]